MFKNNIFTKAVSIMVMGSFAFVTTPKKTYAQMLVPVSFSQMYYLAQNGQVEALRASVHRGMNIDVMNRNGDTGLCIAARRRDSYTYNAFRAAGANPRHPCTQTVEGYEDFVNSAQTTPINSTSRAAYGMMGKESYTVAPWVWWTAGALLVGGGVALALSGGGGGGGGSDSPAPKPVVNNVDSAGRYLAQNGSIKYTAAKGEVKTNSSDISMNNGNTTINTMDFNKDVTQNGKELNVILSSKDGGSYTNNANTDLTAKNGVVAMSAYKSGSFISNNGALNVVGHNAAIGMLAGDNATAYNNGSENNGINLSFSGYNTTDTIIGMYADAGSNIVNKGTINGTASLTSEDSGTTTATKGSMTGMEVMIVNANTDSSATTSEAINNGTIDLVAGQNSTGSEEKVEVSVVGMGTYLDNGFLNGSKNIKRAEKASIKNNDTINLSYYGVYSSAGNYLRQGTGGIIGMKADANGAAINNKDININMSTSDSSPNTYAVAAGMQSIHGGNITNSANGNISLAVSADDNRVAYGMVAVEGSGTVSGLYNIEPTVINDGKINLNISNGYGMASYTGGTLTNNNDIVLGTAEGEYASNNYTGNIGMYASDMKETKLTNSGTIKIYSKDSVAMKNDFSGKTTITNNDEIIIYAGADGSHPFAGTYSNIINKGDIIYNVSETGGESGDFPDKFTFGLKNAVINTDGENKMPSSGSSTGSSKYSDVTITNEKKITLNGSSYTAAMLNQGSEGKLINNGTILLIEKGGYNTYQSVGMYASADTGINSAVINKGSIWVYTQYSGAIVSDATDEGAIITNDTTGEIVVNNDNSVGMYASGSASIYNNGTIRVVGNNSFAIIAKGKGTGAAQQSIYNNGQIILSADGATAFYIADKSTAIVVKEGTIIVNGDDTIGYRIDGELTIYTLPEIEGETVDNFIYYDVAGKLTVDLASAETISKSTLARAISGGVVEITSRSTMNTGADNTTLFKGLAGSEINNSGTLNIAHANSYGINTKGSATNNGTISVSGEESYGIYANNGATTTNAAGATVNVGANSSYGMYAQGSATNSGTINVSGNSSYGMHAYNGGTVTNSSIIEVSGEGSIGINLNGEGGSTATGNNEGTINVTGAGAIGTAAYKSNATSTNSGTINMNGNSSIGMYALNGGNITNNNAITINENATNSYGMYTDGEGSTATNAEGATIYVNGNMLTGIYANNGATATNAAGANVNVGGNSSYGMYTDGSSSSNSGTISVSGEESYGIYANNGATATNAAGATVNVGANSSYGMYAQGSATNSGTINVSGNSSYGMHAYNGGTATNSSIIEVSGGGSIGINLNGEGESPATGNNESTINVTGAGAIGTAAYKSNATSINNGTINVNGNSSYGMSALDGGKITNNNAITINEDATNSYGMYADGEGSTATNAAGATISVNGNMSTGMYANNGATATNAAGATIYVNGNNSYGMVAKNGGTVINNGTITVDNDTSPDSYGIYKGTGSNYTNNGTINAAEGHDVYEETSGLTSFMASPLMMSATKAGKIVNNGVINANSAIDFNSDETSSISVGNGGSYVAPSFSGDVLADSNITLGGFENEYTNVNSFVGEDKGLNINSGSYLFDAQKAVNDNGNIDVVMTKKDFAEVVENSSLAEFLEENYAENNNEALYNDLKASGNSAEFNQNINNLFGNDLISELTFEDLNMLRELNFDMNNNIFAQEKGSFALADGIEIVKKEKFGSTGQYALAGYNDGKTTVGVGLSVSEVNVAKNKHGQKAKHGKNIMLSMPISHKTKGFEFITSPKAGYASGNYEREGINGMSYDGNVERKTLALMNEARYPLKLNGVKIIPSAEFNMIGYNMKAKEDKKQYSLNIKSQNHYSVESGLGLNIEKEFATSKDSKLMLNGGVSFYKEFADPYDLKVSMNEMNGTYKIKDEKHGDNRTVLRFGAGYKLKENLDLSAMIRTNIDREYRTDTGVSLNYHF